MGKKLKKKFLLILKKSKLKKLEQLLIYVNLVIFHRSEKMKYVKKSSNSNADTFFVIKPRSQNEGLLSCYFYVLVNIIFAQKMGYKFYIDFQNENCQYYVGRKINGTMNAWEYYFQQPINDADIFYNSDCNIIQSGWSFGGKKKLLPLPRNLDALSKYNFCDISKNLVDVQPYVKELVEKKYSSIFKNDKTLGVFIRGTDYVSLKPSGHPIQPSIDAVIDKIGDYLEKYNDIKKIYIVTEDLGLYKKIKGKYGDMVFSADDSFVEDYSEGNYIYESMKSDPYERGLNYLVRLLLLNRCQYLVSSITNGSLFAKCINDSRFIDEYWFDLGLYK